MRIGFWATSKERFFVSHQKGLNAEQLEQIRSLKVGDRLCMWQEEVDGNGPNFVVKKLEENKIKNEPQSGEGE